MAKNTQDRVVVDWTPGNKLNEALPDIFLLFFLVVVVAISVWLQSIDPGSNWFMRSGAIVVLLGAVLEYRHNDFVARTNAISIKWAKGVGESTIFEHTKLRRAIGYVAHLCVIVGTFVAAYGDLMLVKL